MTGDHYVSAGKLMTLSVNWDSEGIYCLCCPKSWKRQIEQMDQSLKDPNITPCVVFLAALIGKYESELNFPGLLINAPFRLEC